MAAKTSELTCQICGRKFRDHYNLRRHLARKNPCQPILGASGATANKCRFCGRAFSRVDALKRHRLKNCHILQQENGLELLYDHVAKQAQTQEKRIAELLEKEKELEEIKKNGLTIMDGKNVNVLINLQINVFGKETNEHITSETVKDILSQSLGYLDGSSLKPRALEAVCRTAMMMYSNPDKPENITCYVSNKRQDNAIVHGVKGWELQPISLVIVPMTMGSINTIFDKQPTDNGLVPIMDYIRNHEKDLTYELCRTKDMKALLVRNKDLLVKIFGVLPSTGIQ